MLQIYLRLANIVYSRNFIDTVRNSGIRITRRNKFLRNSIVINHGNSKPISFGRKVNRGYILNLPEYIQYSSNKLKTLKLLKEYFPDTCLKPENVDFKPIIVKPLHGHHGYGIQVFYNKEDLYEFLKHTNEKYIIQRFIPIKHEFRFNVLGDTIFQVSHKERLYDENNNPVYTDKGGMVFRYRSLGSNAKISDKFWNYVYSIVDDINSKLNYKLADYCIDVIKGTDKQYYLSEINSSYGIGTFTINKLLETINDKFRFGELEIYRVV